ncbi:hypothetical protein O6H91_09G004400 [Diphasiastrum complanatum]|uniref:Uncharacterized protein n=2 Tax=Diphasiastrum complanatum TaxID=34168 RepID=A0ACC2CKX6_DIPCM|nr:hypothetical protein O6H91_09G004400 [Diphasiastrum complanatum]KAJ7542638.1 hypothetical protein O6H91_09G004400 [Diphasiastrum complanatum]
MAQCFTETKPFSPSPLHMYGSACSKQFYSSDGSIDRIQGYSQTEGSRKEGGLLIKGYGSFGMPGGHKVNKEILDGRSNQGSHVKSSVKEEQFGLVCPNEHRAPSVSDCSFPSTVGNGLGRSPLSSNFQPGHMASASTATETGNGADKRSVVVWNGSGGSSVVKGSASTDRTSLGKMVIGNNSKVGDIPKPNQSSRGGIVGGASVAEGFFGGRASSLDGSTEGVVLAAISKTGNENALAYNGGLPVATSAGESTTLMGQKHDLSSQRTPPQSWPNSPANLRAVPRTRNLSEGSFNLIFPVGDFEKALSGTRSNVGSPSRSWLGAGSTSASRSSSDGCLLGTMYSPVNSRGAVTRTKSDPENSSESGSKEFGSPTKDVQFAPTTKKSDKSACGHQPICISRTNTTSLGSNSTCSQPASHASQSVTPTAKLSNSECQNRGASDGYTSPTVGNSSGMPGSSHSHDKSLNHGVITGGSFGRTLSTRPSVTSPHKGALESTSFGNISKGFQNGPMLTTMPSSYGNIIKENANPDMKKPNSQINGHVADETFSLKKALASLDPEEVKNIGNDHYKKGRFAEALLLYERAIVLLPGQALFHSNRAAALLAVGRLADAVQECHEALKLDPLYGRAHQRLASLLLRLGRAEDARKHFKAAGSLSDQRDMQRSDIIFRHVAKCLEARSVRDWASVIRESDAAVVAGADSASKVFALKAEALLRIGKTDEATRVISAAQKVESSLKRNMALADSFVQIVQAEIYLALGKFQEAIVAAEKGIQIDSKNLEASAILQKARSIGRSRTTGNELYKAGKFFEASAAYGEGLEHDPANAVLLCNRAACRSNLGLYESAIEDCDAALTAQPNYIKARLRRAHCYAKLEHWEEALRDYEMLRRELPGDIEVARALFDVQAAWKKSRGEVSFKKSFGEGIHEVSTTNQFREAITSPGLAVVYFNSEDSVGCGQLSAYVIQLCKKYPAVNFLKVDVKENRQVAKLEKVATVPSFQLYKNGLKVKEIQGSTYTTLEQAIELFVL